MDISYGQPVSGRLQAIDIHIDVETLRDAFRKHRAEFGNTPQDLLQLRPRLLNHFHVWALNLQAYWGLDARQLHVETVLHGHGPSIRQSRELKLFVHLVDQFFVGHPGTPLFAWFEHDGGVVHVQRSIVGGTVGSAHGTKDTFDLGEGFDDTVLLLKERGGLSDGDSRKCCRHVKRRALIERRHELAPNAPSQRKGDQRER